MLALTVNFNLPGGTKLVYGRFNFDDDAEVLTYRLEVRSASATDSLICWAPVSISNVASTLVTRQASPAAGLDIDDINRYLAIGSRSTPTGYTDAKTADRSAANNKAARRLANETHQSTAGHIDPVSLAGVNS
jgi:hypothetical protein